MVLYLWEYYLSGDTYGFRRIAVIDNATSVIWHEKFNALGDFEIYIRASSDLLDIVSSGHIFVTRDDRDTAMYIESVLITTDEENGDYLTISGHTADIMLNWRVLSFMSNNVNTAEYIMRSTLEPYIPASGSRLLPGQLPPLKLGTAQGYTDELRTQYSYRTPLYIVQDLCTRYNYGYKLVFDGESLIFELYKGTDRSFDQSENTFVIFSPDFGNLGKTSYKKDTSNYYNTAIVGGEGEGKDRVRVTVRPEAVGGLDMRQIFVDARNISSNTGSTPLTSEQYQEVLREHGIDAIAQHKVETTFNGEILSVNSYQYGVDYGLGDKVSIENTYGIRGNATVTGITEVEDDTGYTLVPTLEEWTVYDMEA